MYMCACLCECMLHVYGCCFVQKSVGCPEAIVTGICGPPTWVTGIEFGSSGRSESTLTAEASLQPPFSLILKAFVRSQFIPSDQNLLGE